MGALIGQFCALLFLHLPGSDLSIWPKEYKKHATRSEQKLFNFSSTDWNHLVGLVVVTLTFPWCVTEASTTSLLWTNPLPSWWKSNLCFSLTSGQLFYLSDVFSSRPCCNWLVFLTDNCCCKCDSLINTVSRFLSPPSNNIWQWHHPLNKEAFWSPCLFFHYNANTQL